MIIAIIISINPDYGLAYFKRGKAKEKTANFEGAIMMLIIIETIGKLKTNI